MKVCFDVLASIPDPYSGNSKEITTKTEDDNMFQPAPVKKKKMITLGMVYRYLSI